MSSHPLFRQLRERYGPDYNRGRDVGFQDEDRRGYAGPGHWENVGRWDSSAVGLLDAFAALYPTPRPARALDVGCGRGVMVEALAQREVWAVGVDLGADVRSRRCAQANALALPFASGTFDMVAALDLVEHVPWDLQDALHRELRRVLAPRGLLFVTVPTRAPRFCYSSDVGVRNHYLTLLPLEWVGLFERFSWRVLAHGEALAQHGPPFSWGEDNYPLAMNVAV